MPDLEPDTEDRPRKPSQRRIDETFADSRQAIDTGTFDPRGRNYLPLDRPSDTAGEPLEAYAPPRRASLDEMTKEPGLYERVTDMTRRAREAIVPDPSIGGTIQTAANVMPAFRMGNLPLRPTLNPTRLDPLAARVTTTEGNTGFRAWQTSPRQHEVLADWAANMNRPQPTPQYVKLDDGVLQIMRQHGVAGLSMLPPATAAYLATKLVPVDHDPFATEATQ